MVTPQTTSCRPIELAVNADLLDAKNHPSIRLYWTLLLSKLKPFLPQAHQPLLAPEALSSSLRPILAEIGKTIIGVKENIEIEGSSQRINLPRTNPTLKQNFFKEMGGETANEPFFVYYILHALGFQAKGDVPFKQSIPVFPDAFRIDNSSDHPHYFLRDETTLDSAYDLAAHIIMAAAPSIQQYMRSQLNNTLVISSIPPVTYPSASIPHETPSTTKTSNPVVPPVAVAKASAPIGTPSTTKISNHVVTTAAGAKTSNGSVTLSTSKTPIAAKAPASIGTPGTTKTSNRASTTKTLNGVVTPSTIKTPTAIKAPAPIGIFHPVVTLTPPKTPIPVGTPTIPTTPNRALTFTAADASRLLAKDPSNPELNNTYDNIELRVFTPPPQVHTGEIATLASIEQNWKAFIYLLKMNDVDLEQPLDREKLQKLCRKFFVNLLEENSCTDKIMVGKHSLLMQFPVKTRLGPSYRNKAAFLNEQKINYVWGNEALLLFGLYHLGYQPIFHLPTENKKYPPYQHSFPISKIEIINFGASRGGVHWELEGKSNLGGGNCMFYTIADQFTTDLPHIYNMLEKSQRLVVQNYTSYLTELEKEAIQKERREFEPYEILAEKLEDLSLDDLCAIYKTIPDTDDYLKNAIFGKTRAQEYDENPGNAANVGTGEEIFSLLKNTIQGIPTANVSLDIRVRAKKVLVTSLTMEARKNCNAEVFLTEYLFNCTSPSPPAPKTSPKASVK